MKQQVIHIGERKQKLIILSPKSQTKPLPGILWIHGGGYMIGMASMVHMSRSKDLAEKFGAVVVRTRSLLYKIHGKEEFSRQSQERNLKTEDRLEMTIFLDVVIAFANWQRILVLHSFPLVISIES